MHEAYNPPEKAESEIDNVSLEAPANSMQSVEQIEFYSSDEEGYKINPAEIDTR